MSGQARRNEGRQEDAKGPDNEIRVKATTYTRTYLAYIDRLFKDNHDKIIIKGTGYAIPRAVALAMLTRKRFKGLHQIVEVGTNDFKDRDFTRKVGLITIILSKKPLDSKHIGYSAPLPDTEITEYTPYVPGIEPPGRGVGRGFGRGRARGGFGGRGRNFRRGYGGRGGYGGNYGYGGGYRDDYEGGYGRRYGRGYGGGYGRRSFGTRRRRAY